MEEKEGDSIKPRTAPNSKGSMREELEKEESEGNKQTGSQKILMSMVEMVGMAPTLYQ